MTHPDSDLTATIERDLRAVDAALEDGAATHGDPLARELQELALALRADAADPDEEFAAMLGERAKAGFPAAPGSARARVDGARSWLGELRRDMPPPRRMLPAAAALVTVVVIGIAVASLDPQLTNNSSDDGGGGGGSVAQDSGGGGGAEAAPGAGSSSTGKAEPALPFAQPDRAQSGALRLRRPG